MRINKKLASLLKLLEKSQTDNIPFPKDKIIGCDLEDIKPGQKVTITFTNPYRVEHGILIVLPGIDADNILKGGIVYIPESYQYPGKQLWIIFKYAAILADTIEVEPYL